VPLMRHDRIQKSSSPPRRMAQHIGSEDFVFCKPNVSPYSQMCSGRMYFMPALDPLHIPRISRMCGFHAFRHSAGSIGNVQTGNLELAQKLLEHSNLSTTADIYTQSETEAARRMSGQFSMKLLPNRSARSLEEAYLA